MRVTLMTDLFTKEVDGKGGDSSRKVLTADFTVCDEEGVFAVVPAGFYTDFASVPRLPLVYAFAANYASKAATLHDYLYFIGYDRALADKAFYAAMRYQGVWVWRRALMYAAVRAFGHKAYSNYREKA